MGFGFSLIRDFILDANVDKIYLNLGLNSNFLVNIFYPMVNLIIYWIIFLLIRFLYNKGKKIENEQILL